MNLFGKKNYISLEKPETRRPERRMKSKEPSIPDGMWIKCNSCKNIIYKKEVTKYKLCPNCEAHFRMSPKERIGDHLRRGDLWKNLRLRCILKIRWDIRIMIR